MSKIIVCAVLLCLSAVLAFAMRRNKNNPGSVFKKSLFRVKSVRVFPVTSLAYAFFSFVILFFGLLAVDRASGYERCFQEDLIETFMGLEKFDGTLDYPLMAIKGRENIRGEHPKILVLGDSFVWGHGLSNSNQIWWSIMASELARRGYDCEVYAVGYPGASTYDEFRWLRDTALLEDIQPDLIIIGYVTNDADLDTLRADMGMESHLPEYVDQRLDGIASTLWDGKKGLLQEIYPNTYVFLWMKFLSGGSMGRRLRLLQPVFGYTYTDWEEELAKDINLKDYNTYVLQPMGEFIERDSGVPSIVMPTPEAPRGKNYDLLYGDVLPLFEQAGFPVYNPLGKFIEQYPKPNRKLDKYYLVSPVNPHPGPLTSWFLGKYAADVLEQEYASVIGEKEPRGQSKLSIEINDWLPFMLEPQAIQESGAVSQYTIEYPDQSSKADLESHVHGNFLAYPLAQKHVKLNFKYPVRLSAVKIEGEDLLSAEVHTLAINHTLGFDDQKPVGLGKRSGGGTLVWIDGSERDVTSLLISAKTKDGKQAPLTVIIEGEVALW